MTGLLVTGALLGMRHALDPDHLVAVSTLVSEERRILPAARLGLIWGLGHILPVTVLGCIFLLIRTNVTDAVQDTLELGVGLLLIGLGTSSLWRLYLERVHVHLHEHGGRVHAHFHHHGPGSALDEPDEHPSSHHETAIQRRGLLTFATGLVHGLAGSGLAAVLAASAAPTLPWGIAYLFVFGAGSAIGMFAVTLFLTAPLLFISDRFAALQGGIRGLAGIASIGVGIGLWMEILPHWM